MGQREFADVRHVPLELYVAVHIEHIAAAGQVVEGGDSNDILCKRRIILMSVIPHHGEVTLGNGTAGRVVDIADEEPLDAFPQT